MVFDPTKVNLGADLLTSQTSVSRDPWQEAFKKFSSIPASKVIQASEGIRGFSGSWAASYLNGDSISKASLGTESTIPSNSRTRWNLLGQVGMPEIDFVPYCRNTNRFGNKGGALIGQPISFSIVGPTAKQGNKITWQWVVDPVANTLTIDSLETDPTTIPLNLTPGVPSTILAQYGIVAADFNAQFDGGLYLVINHTGKIGNGLGIGDEAAMNTAGAAAANVRHGIVPKTSTSQTEIFRITGVVGSTLQLDSNKPLTAYFTMPVTGIPVVRFVTLFEPVATRLAAVPDSGLGRGREQVFSFLPPRRALTGEYQPLCSDWTVNAYTEYPFDSSVFEDTTVQSLFSYEYQPQLPVVRPIRTDAGSLSYSPTSGHGTMTVLITDYTDYTIGQIIRITNVSTTGNPTLLTQAAPLPVRSASLDSLYGYFEIVGATNAPNNRIIVRRYDEVNPQNAIAFRGNPKNFQVVGTPGVDEIHLSFTVHNPVNTLWTSRYYDVDKIDSTRLTNLIDPRWVERSTPGYTPKHGDLSIFNTAGGNPGNLADLGFRVVLFPAKTKTVPTETGTESILVPDFSRPICSNEAVIDPTKPTEKQFVEVDYANGLLRLSHAPYAVYVGQANAADLSPTDDIFNSADNPRKEFVLFASCVPYTDEASQNGMGIRITQDLEASGESVGLFGDRVKLDAYTADGLVQSISSSSQLVSATSPVLAVKGFVADQIPKEGVFQLFKSGVPVLSGLDKATFGYTGVVEYPVGSAVLGILSTTEDMTILYGVFGTAAAGGPVTISLADPVTVVFRRLVGMPSDSSGVTKVGYQEDVTYGDAKRVSALRFKGAGLQDNLDGSVTVDLLENKLVLYVGEVSYPFKSFLPNPHFNTVYDAVIYAHTIMGQEPYLKVTIKVVGKTVEYQTITILDDGLTIEGSPLVGSGSSEITWFGDFPLFTLNGKNDLTFKGLSFYRPAGKLTNTHVFFGNTPSKRLKIEDNRFNGAVGSAPNFTSLLTISAGGLSDSFIQKNIALDNSSLAKGIKILGTSRNNYISENLLSIFSTGEIVNSNGVSDIIFGNKGVGTIISTGASVVVSKNELDSISVTSNFGKISENSVGSITTVGANIQVCGNVLTPTLSIASTSILMTGADNCVISSNTLTKVLILDGTISITSANGLVEVVKNKAHSLVLVQCGASTIEGNMVDLLNLSACSGACILSNNRINTTASMTSVDSYGNISGDDYVISGNVFSGDLKLTPCDLTPGIFRSILTGNFINNITNESFAGLKPSGLIIVGNRFDSNISYFGGDCMLVHASDGSLDNSGHNFYHT